METAAPSAHEAPDTGIPVSEIDWTRPLELSDGTPLRLACGSELRAAFGATNPDADGDWWVARADGKLIMGQTIWCFSPEGADDFIGLSVRNRVCPEDGNKLSDDGICGFCGTAPEAFASAGAA